MHSNFGMTMEEGKGLGFSVGDGLLHMAYSGLQDVLFPISRLRIFFAESEILPV